jgi:hypothetical protein
LEGRGGAGTSAGRILKLLAIVHLLQHELVLQLRVQLHLQLRRYGH